MKWLSVHKDGTPNAGRQVLTFSECYRETPEAAFRIMDGQFVRVMTDVTHYYYLEVPEQEVATWTHGDNQPLLS